MWTHHPGDRSVTTKLYPRYSMLLISFFGMTMLRDLVPVGLH